MCPLAEALLAGSLVLATPESPSEVDSYVLEVVKEWVELLVLDPLWFGLANGLKPAVGFHVWVDGDAGADEALARVQNLALRDRGFRVGSQRDCLSPLPIPEGLPQDPSPDLSPLLTGLAASMRHLPTRPESRF